MKQATTTDDRQSTILGVAPMSLTRREFFASSAALALAPTLGRAANDQLNIGVIGPGGRGRWLMERAMGLPGIKITAIADIYDGSIAAAQKMVPDADVHRDFNDLLARDDIDAVIIASPDHWHAAMTIAAVEAGKHVYVEKPVTHWRDNGQELIDAVNRSGKAVQVGTQQRSMPHLQEGKELVQDGQLGELVRIRMSWNRNTPRGSGKSNIKQSELDWDRFCGPAGPQPFNPYVVRGSWRFFWPYGGGIFTDLMVHWFDTALWMTDLPQVSWAAGTGSFQRMQGIWETPDTVQCLLRFQDSPVQAHFAGTFSQHDERAMLQLQGTEATLYCDRGRYELRPQRGSKIKPRERIDGTSVRGGGAFLGADFYDQVDGAQYHIAQWVSVIRNGGQTICPVEAGVAAADGAHMANKSMRSGNVEIG